MGEAAAIETKKGRMKYLPKSYVVSECENVVAVKNLISNILRKTSPTRSVFMSFFQDSSILNL